ncbi:MULTISPECIES: FAD-dependent oxidoreductase [Streptomyces]|uniref:FAD-binding oxidoreductase n=1 Tax=Streptomyces dengpaensis TaxID=2049881 RepID=A0ABM6T2Y6_9ACTN|nr:MULTISPECIES: FAD-dependent oxidoreductase [Streptomyces]AVH61431.1 FAD-binding oxidoreductase [Streptomyces dengpaensis]PIB11451.1 hypothetical protein B1C81_05765 [Streptomyces sp. HG99]
MSVLSASRRTEGGSRALVIGAGVSGLTTALCLRRRGLAVTVVADKLSPDIVSAVAGALWEWPPAVCGHHQDTISLKRSKEWCMVSYRAFTELSGDPATGVRLRPAVSYFRRPVAEVPRELAKMRELSHLPGFRHDAALITENRLGEGAKAVDAYTHLAPVIDTEAYMDWLLARVLTAGATLVQGMIDSGLVTHEQDLLRRYDADVIVNCAGLGAMFLSPDASMYPLRGALFHVRNDDRMFPRITTAHLMAHDDAHPGQNMVFVVPRNDTTLVLGGLVEEGEWSIDLAYRHEPVRAMVRRCSEFLPMLRDAIPLPDPVRVGVRPARKGNVRLETEFGTRIVHNYGHGGSGFTLSWGCAEEAAELAARIA